MKKFLQSFAVSIILLLLAVLIAVALIFFTRTVNVVHRDFPSREGYVRMTDTASLGHLENDVKYHITAQLMQEKETASSSGEAVTVSEPVLDKDGNAVTGSTMIDTGEMEYALPYIGWLPCSGVFADVEMTIYIDEETYQAMLEEPEAYSIEYDYAKYYG